MPENDIQQAIAPLVRGIDKLELSVERVMTRIDNLPNVYMSRSEYEPRHKALEDDIGNLRQDFAELKKSLAEERHTFSSSQIAIWVAVAEGIIAIVLHFLK